MKLSLPKSSKKTVFSFGTNKKLQEGTAPVLAGSSQTADAAEIIEDSRNDVVNEIGGGEGTDAIAKVLETEDSVRDVDLHGDLDSKTSKIVPSETDNASVSSKFGGRIKKSFRRTKKGKASSVEICISNGGNIDAVEGGFETKDSVQQEDAVLDTKESAQQGDTADLRDETVLESSAMVMSALPATLPSNKEEPAEEKASAPEDPLNEEAHIVDTEEEDAAMTANEEAPAKELDGPTVEANEEVVTAVKPEQDAWMHSVETFGSVDDQPSIEAVQQDGRVALGYFEAQSSTMEEVEVSLLAQTRQFAEFAAQMMEQSCLSPCAGKVEEWQTSVTPKVQEWQASVVPMVQEWQVNVMSKKLMGTTTENATTPESTTEEEDRNDSSFNENPNVVRSEDSLNEIRVV